MIKGIDVSSWQGNIDFAKVKASGIDFVIIFDKILFAKRI